MQWSPDRNGGFSKADPERLVLPPLMGNLYGYETVNVESQARDPYSLLNWMRRMLAKRQQYRVFGRGKLRFIYPGNRKVLVYLREHEDVTILCVANLSHAPQAVEIDLKEFAGRVPVELTGGTAFPAIGQLTYLLTLPPFGFYWFDLSTQASPPSWHLATSDQLPEYRTLVLRNRAGYELMPGSRQTLENEVLPQYLGLRRWFASKQDKVNSARIVYGARLQPAAGASAIEELYMAEIEADLGERKERYVVPLALIWDEALPPLPQQLAIARIRRGPQVGMVTDAFSLRSFAVTLIDNLHAKAHIDLPVPAGTAAGTPGAYLEFRPEPGLDQMELTDETNVRWLSAEQSNSSLVIGTSAVLKVVRRVMAGIHPEAEMTRHLTTLGFGNTANLLGEVVRVDADGTPHTLSLVQQYLSNQGDAWTWTLSYLGRSLDNAALTDESVEDYDQELLGYNTFAAAIGKRLAQMHTTLALPSDDPAFAPETAGKKDTKAWVDDACAMLDKAMDALAAMKTWPGEDLEALARSLLESRSDLKDSVRKLASRVGAALKTRTHGDFHLGQVLVVQNDAYLIDFEGEPARTLDERRRKTNPLRDVAGLLRSFDYAAAAVVGGPDVANAGVSATAGTPTSGVVTQRRDVLLDRFRTVSSSAFLQAYRDEASSSAHAWFEDSGLDALLDIFLVEKAAYEICYEAANRPNWIGIPLRGMALLSARVAAIGTRESNDN
jgi:maltose alpha-D-glucosyltransferase/alpha-amylase